MAGKWKPHTDWKRRKIKQLLKRDGPRCRYCKRPFSGSCKPTIDHVMPRSKGGEPFEMSNLVLACEPCNKDKADTILQPDEVPASETPHALPQLDRQVRTLSCALEG